MTENKETEDIEIHLLLKGIYDRYGFDFRDYAPASLKRRIFKSVFDEGVKTISALQEKLLHDSTCMNRFLRTVSVDVSSMFRDPLFYQTIREKILPMFRSEPLIRIWHAGCASGEEVYSMAIVLHEEGLYDKSRIYATDMNSALLEEAKAGVYQLSVMKDFADNYRKAGGKASASEYYTAMYDRAIFSSPLKKNIVWANHNLATDSSFNEFHIILCRNVMIYFNSVLQNRVHTLFYESLPTGGILGLGKSETFTFTAYESKYEEIDAKEKLYRKIL